MRVRKREETSGQKGGKTKSDSILQETVVEGEEKGGKDYYGEDRRFKRSVESGRKDNWK